MGGGENLKRKENRQSGGAGRIGEERKERGKGEVGEQSRREEKGGEGRRAEERGWGLPW